MSSVLGAKYGETVPKAVCFTSVLSLLCTWIEHNRCATGLAVNNKQQVVSITDRVLGTQVWYNLERSRKPQTFMQVRSASSDMGKVTSFSQFACTAMRWAQCLPSSLP